ncbi:replication restart helicase PriA [Porphyromonas pogonae]|uniref:replication restart helicase PriA n=1 Tax=Porphyromonas pogonae TaxID=867595 RepID=UPI002E7AAC2D|nr:primosomal protein N' [Porphyromonas pogonae]
MKYAEVILPLAVNGTFHYRIPFFLEDMVSVGKRVIVPFGTKRFYTGIVVSLSDALPMGITDAKLKNIDDVPDTPDQCIVNQDDIDLWYWVSSYYACSVGEVMHAALPAGLLPESKTIVKLNTSFEADSVLETTDQRILDLLDDAKGKELNMATLQKLVGKSAVTSFNRLIELGAICLQEQVLSRYTPRKRIFISLHPSYATDEEALCLLLDSLGRAVKQREVVEAMIDYCESVQLPLSTRIPRYLLSGRVPNAQSAIDALCKKGVLIKEELEVSRIISEAGQKPLPSSLGNNAPITHPKELSHGVTVYYAYNPHDKERFVVEHISRVIASGKQVLFLTPSAYNLPSSHHFIEQVEKASGGKLFYYNSSTSDAVKVELFRHLSRSSEPCVVLGMRAAVFVPMKNVGLIIVDEEHEYLYKQQNPAPRFHARDVALWLAKQRGCDVLLTSETPSAETLFNVLRGKYEIINCYHQDNIQDLNPTRDESVMIQTVNITEARDRKTMPRDSLVTPELKHEINRMLMLDKRVMILQNRRGYAPYIICNNCGSRVRCPHCDVSLTYYRNKKVLACRYCGFTDTVPQVCPSCGVHASEMRSNVELFHYAGYGSERVEDEIQTLFPEASIVRLDSDILQSSRKAQEAHEKIARGDVDIYVGTQMIKGQPVWDDVGLIAVPQLESILGFPDFRSYERAYQLLYQLILRSFFAGDQGNRPVKILIQTADPSNPFIQWLSKGNYSDFIKEQLAERKLLMFPPFVRMTIVIMKCYDEDIIEEAAQEYYALLEKNKKADIYILPPQKPSVSKIDLQYIRHIMLRRPLDVMFEEERKLLLTCKEYLYDNNATTRKVRIYFDVDPL